MSGFDSYGGVPLGVESAWPRSPVAAEPKAARKRGWTVVSAGLVLVLATLFLAACSALGTADCGPDWHAVGVRDGRIGAQPQVESYAGRCGVGVDSAEYLRGWQEGVRQRPIPTS